MLEILVLEQSVFSDFFWFLMLLGESNDDYLMTDLKIYSDYSQIELRTNKERTKTMGWIKGGGRKDMEYSN